MSDIDPNELKLVKANEREVEVDKPVKYSYLTHKVKEKQHDLEFHNNMGEPVFQVEKEYGNNYRLKWHPYMKELHPDLETSFEHGSRQPHYHHVFTAKGKNDLGYSAGFIYKKAASSGFRDEIPHTVTPTPTPESPKAHKITFHDPETNEPIVTQHFSGDYSGSNDKISYHSEYLGKNGISPEQVQGMKHGGHGYTLAKMILGERGKDVTAVGNKSYAGKDSGHTSSTYKAIPGKTDEDLSAAHEKQVRVKYGEKSNFQLVRHTPTVFHATGGKNKYDNFHITSVAHGGQLVHHKINPDYEYSGEKLDERF